MVAIRDADAADIPALRGIYRGAVHALAPGLYAEDQIAAGSGFAAAPEFDGFVLDVRSFVAVRDGRPVGFCGIAPDGHVASVYVDADECRRGIGTLLLLHALDACPAPTSGRWYAEASLLSRGLFARCGFRQTGVERVERGGVVFERYLMVKPAMAIGRP